MAINTHSYAVVGSAIPVEAALTEKRRRSIMLYAKQGTCYVTIGKYDADNELAITEGNTLELNVNYLDQVWYRGVNSSMVVITDTGFYAQEHIRYGGEVVFLPESTTHVLERFTDS